MLKSKKILYIITQTKWGGAQKYVLQLAKYFNKNNEIHIAFGEIKNKNKKFLNDCKKLKVKTIPIKYLVRNIDIGKDYLAIINIIKLLKKENYNLVHLNSSKVGLLGSISSKIYNMNPTNLRLRIIYTAHGFIFNEPLSKLKKKIYKISEKISTKIQDVIITVSHFDKKSALKNKICPSEKIFTIHNGLDINKYKFLNKEEALNKLNLNKKYKYFGTIASFYKTKGHTYLIEAIKLLKKEKSKILNNHKFIFIGSGPEKENIKQLIKKYNLEKYIKIIKSKDNDWKYLKAFNYFILPSIKEGLPYTILEAGLAKIPILATKVGGIPEILKNKKTGIIVTSVDSIALLQGIKEINKDNNKLINNNYINIINNFNLNTTLKQTKELYNKLF